MLYYCKHRGRMLILGSTGGLAGSTVWLKILVGFAAVSVFDQRNRALVFYDIALAQSHTHQHRRNRTG